MADDRTPSTAESADSTSPIGRGAWLALIAALLGWMFDGAEMGVFSLVGRPAIQDLLGPMPARLILRTRKRREIIKRIFQVKGALKKDIKIASLENYDMKVGRMMTSGTDIWLNTPQPPLEASGTSGMKAALNGVPSLSVLDGWWIEGCIEGETGWSIGEIGSADTSKDATSLYSKLEEIIIPMFYQGRDRFIDIMLHCIALNGSFFNTQRMVHQYVLNAYFR